MAFTLDHFLGPKHSQDSPRFLANLASTALRDFLSLNCPLHIIFFPASKGDEKTTVLLGWWTQGTRKFPFTSPAPLSARTDAHSTYLLLSSYSRRKKINDCFYLVIYITIKHAHRFKNIIVLLCFFLIVLYYFIEVPHSIPSHFSFLR